MPNPDAKPTNCATCISPIVLIGIRFEKLAFMHFYWIAEPIGATPSLTTFTMSGIVVLLFRFAEHVGGEFGFSNFLTLVIEMLFFDSASSIRRFLGVT